MVIQRVRPQGWSRKQILTSTEITQIDERLSNALDKTIYGDTLAGTMTIAENAKLDFQSGSELIMRVGSSIDIQGSTAYIELNSGSTLINDGYTTLTNATVGTLNVSSGNHTISGNVNISGGTATFASSAPIIAQDVEITGTLAYTPTLVTRHENSSPVHTGGFTIDNGSNRRLLMPVSTTQYIYHTLSVPNLCVITNVTAYLRGAQVSRTGSDVPSVLPKIELFRQLKTTGAASLIATATDGSTLASTYESYHSISITTSHLTNRQNYLYFVRVTPESGTNSAANCEYYGLAWTVEVSSQDFAL